MRPARFETFLREQIAASGAVADVQTRTDAGVERTPARGDYGVRVTLKSGGAVEMMITAQSAPGDAYSEPEAIVEGEQVAPIALSGPIDGSKVRVADLETFIASVIAGSGSREVAEIGQRFSEQEPAGAISHGMVVRFHSGARVYLNFVTAHPAGQRPGADYQCPDVI
jgi:hypothetical protein